MRRSILIPMLFLAATASAGTFWLLQGAFGDDLLLNPESIDFGVVAIGEEAQQVAIATNTGDAPIEIDSIQVPEGFGASRTGLQLDPGASAEIVLTYRPEEPGSVDGELVLSGPSLSDRTVRIAALAQLPPSIEVNPQRISFGEVGVGDSTLVELEIANRGQGELRVDAVAVPKPFIASDVTLEVPAGTTRTLELRFAPEETGKFSQILSIRSNDPEQALVQVRLGGLGVAESPDPRIDVDPLALSFGKVSSCTGPVRWVSVRNGGSDTLMLSAFRYPEGFMGPARSRRVKPGREFSFPVTFAPRVGGALEGELRIFSNDPTAGMVAVALSGKGVACGEEAIAQIAERRPRPPRDEESRGGSRFLGGSGGGGAFGSGNRSATGAATDVADAAANPNADPDALDAEPGPPSASVGEDSSWRLASYQSKFDGLNVDASFYDPATGDLRLEISPPPIDAALGEFFQGEWVVEGQIDPSSGDFQGNISMTIYDPTGKPTELVIPIPPPYDTMPTGDGQPVFAPDWEPFVDGEGVISFLDILPREFTLGGQPIQGSINVSLNDGE